jgi:hypothetical protein
MTSDSFLVGVALGIIRDEELSFLWCLVMVGILLAQSSRQEGKV